MGKHWAYERGLLWGLDLDDSGDNPPPLVTPRLETEFEELHESAIDSLAAAMDLDVQSVQQRLKSGRRCVIGKVDGAIATYGWISQGKECVGELEREIHMKAGEAYIWDCGTLPAFRRQGLYSALLSYSNQLLYKEGAGKIWIGTGEANVPSLGGIINAGFQPAIRVIYLRVTRMSCMWVLGYAGVPEARVSAAQRALTGSHERALGRLVVAASLHRMRLSSCMQLNT